MHVRGFLPSARPFLGAATLLLMGILAACGDSPTGAAAEACGPLPLFTALPLDPGDIGAVTVVGGLGAPGHTLPTAHAGIYVAREGAPVFSPGRVQVVEIRRVRYLVSPNRQGEEDYAINYRVCRDVEGWFGHVTSLASAVFSPGSLTWGSCTSYSTAEESIENCFARPGDLWLSPGEAIGTAGHSIALGLMGYDVGLLDRSVNHFHAAPWRHPVNSAHAVCPWEYYDATSRGILFGKLADMSRPGGPPPDGEPRCGTMEVDVAGTAKGVWADPAITTPLAGDERRYLTLANNPYRPQLELALSLGPEELGAQVAVVTRETAGRVNRAFEHVGPDGLIYCYGPGGFAQQESWFLSLSAGGSLTMQRIAHATGASPCASPPSGWGFGAGAVTFVR